MEVQQRKRLSQAIRTIAKTQAQAERQSARQKAVAAPGDRRRMLQEYQKAMAILESFFGPEPERN